MKATCVATVGLYTGDLRRSQLHKWTSYFKDSSPIYMQINRDEELGCPCSKELISNKLISSLRPGLYKDNYTLSRGYVGSGLSLDK